VEPRDVPPELAARRLGIELAAFNGNLSALLARGFPEPDATTGNFDLKAIEVWMDRRSGIAPTPVPAAKDATAVVPGRLGRLVDG
jgi:hypothetical protein